MFNKCHWKLLKALGDETRYKIIEELLNGEKCTDDIAKSIGRTQPNTSMHLAKLSDWGIVESRREGKRIFYSLKEKKVCDIFRALGYSKGRFKSRNCRKRFRGGEQDESENN